MPKSLRLVGLISGAGSTLANWLRCQDQGQLNATIVGIVSSRPHSAKNENILGEVVRRNIPLAIVQGHQADDDVSYSRRVMEAIRPWAPDLIGMGGWVHRLIVPDDFQNRIINIHPSLLPKYGGKGFYGRRVHEAVIEAKEVESGCTVHFVDDEYDHGPIILQRRVPVYSDDTPETLRERVSKEEHIVYPEVINQLVSTIKTS